jgi:hypothetical protein
MEIKIVRSFLDYYGEIREGITVFTETIGDQMRLQAMIKYEIHHRAELYICLNLPEVKTPQIYGLSAEEVQEISLKL